MIWWTTLVNLKRGRTNVCVCRIKGKGSFIASATSQGHIIKNNYSISKVAMLINVAMYDKKASFVEYAIGCGHS